MAIPAVWFYNYLTGRIEYFNVEMDNSSSELVDYFIKKTCLGPLCARSVRGGSGHQRAPRWSGSGADGLRYTRRWPLCQWMWVALRAD